MYNKSSRENVAATTCRTPDSTHNITRKFYIYIYIVNHDETSYEKVAQKMSASEALVETLVAHNKKVFGIVGSAFIDPLDLFPAAGINLSMFNMSKTLFI